MDTILTYTTSEELSQSLKTAQLEHAYERALRQAERIYEEERARALRVQLLLLEDENDSLQEQLSDNEQQMERLEDGHDDLRQQLLETEADLLQAQTEIKSRMRITERYKAEAHALNATTSDSAKILTEKLTLARELANLKPELEHLKSQALTQQNNLAEKLALQRELNAMQVELETEKRAVQRIKAQEKSSDADSTLVGEFEELKKELAKERREAQKSERENRKKFIDWENQKDVLESKLDAFRTKLRSTKEQLKEAQDELEKTQTAQFKKSAELTTTRMTGANPRKRNVAHFDPDLTIGTPGNGRPGAKKARITGPGTAAAKPSFSITPFLNRTLSILPESPSDMEKIDEEMNKTIDRIAAEADECAEPPKEKEKPRPVKKAAAPASSKAKPAQPLKESTNPKANAIVQKPRLAKVMEEEDEENEENEPRIQKNADDILDFAVKKQKLLGGKKPSVFDGSDDGEPLKARRKLGLGLRGGGGSSFGDLSFMGSVGQGKTLAAFSPLKKDRKGLVGV